MEPIYFTVPTSHGPITLMSASSFGNPRMDATSNFLGRRLTEVIREQQEAKLRPLIQGVATDFADYKKRAGYLEALGHVLEWIEQISTEEDDHGRGPFARAS